MKRIIVALLTGLLASGCMMDPGGPAQPSASPPPVEQEPIPAPEDRVGEFLISAYIDETDQEIPLSFGFTIAGYDDEGGIVLLEEGGGVLYEDQSALTPYGYRATLKPGVDQVVATMSAIAHVGTRMECSVYDGSVALGVIVDHQEAVLRQSSSPLQMDILLLNCAYPYPAAW